MKKIARILFTTCIVFSLFAYQTKVRSAEDLKNNLPENSQLFYGKVTNQSGYKLWVFLIADYENDKAIKVFKSFETDDKPRDIIFFYSSIEETGPFTDEEDELEHIVKVNLEEYTKYIEENQANVRAYKEYLKLIGMSDNELSSWVEEVKFTESKQ